MWRLHMWFFMNFSIVLEIDGYMCETSRLEGDLYSKIGRGGGYRKWVYLIHIMNTLMWKSILLSENKCLLCYILWVATTCDREREREGWVKSATKVDVPNSQHNFNQEIYIEWYICGIYIYIYMAPKMDTKRNTSKRDWSTCLKCANHSRLTSQHDWEDLWPSVSTRIFTLTMNKICIWAPKTMRQVTTTSTTWIW
jgi:hypothetical protein